MKEKFTMKKQIIANICLYIFIVTFVLYIYFFNITLFTVGSWHISGHFFIGMIPMALLFGSLSTFFILITSKKWKAESKENKRKYFKSILLTPLYLAELPWKIK